MELPLPATPLHAGERDESRRKMSFEGNLSAQNEKQEELFFFFFTMICSLAPAFKRVRTSKTHGAKNVALKSTQLTAWNRLFTQCHFIISLN